MKLKHLWNSVVGFFRAEWEKIRHLSFKDKLSYIWEYYKVHILAISFLIFMVISVSVGIYNNRKGGEVVFGIGVVNDTNVSDDFSDELAANFGEYLGLTYGDQQVKVLTSYTVSDEPNEYQAVLNTVIFLDATAGDLDAVICQREVLEYFPPEQEPWLDLSTVLDAETLEALSDRIFYRKDADGKEFPCGIYLTDNTVGTEVSLTLKEPILAVIGSALHTDYMDDLVDYILETEK